MNADLLNVVGLRMIYRTGGGLLSALTGRQPEPVVAVDGIDLSLGHGETLAIVGESGSGKTTTGRLVTLQERPTDGSIALDGKEVTDLGGRALKRFRREVQMIFQNPYEALDPRLTVGQSVAEPLRLHGIANSAARRERAAAALEAVEMTPPDTYLDRYPSDLSGGQLQRVAIARALILEPRLVVADEPVSMLDVSVRSGVMNLMLDLQQRLGVSYLYITHDLAVARYMSSRIAVMYLGAIMEEGPTEELIHRAAHPYTRLLISAVPEHRSGSRRQRVTLRSDAMSESGNISGCRFRTRCPLARDICADAEPPLRPLASGHQAACHFANEVLEHGLERAAAVGQEA